MSGHSKWAGIKHKKGLLDAKRGECVEILVSDTGIGIPDRDLELIFERFHRSQDPHMAGIEGTGLGLAIARDIVEHHGGRIWAASEHGRGSVFTVALPLAMDPATVPARSTADGGRHL